jgi:hypothetical protein
MSVIHEDKQSQPEIKRRATSEPFENRTQGSKFKKESTMKENASSKLWKDLCRAAIAIVAIGIAAASAVHARPKSKSTAGNSANVVAHVGLSGGPVSRMLLVKKDSKEYLLLGFDSSTNVAIMDVSEPGQPRTIDMAAGAGGAPATELKVVADTLTVFGTSDAETASSSKTKEIRSLSSVTALIEDKANGLIYVTIGEDLWIVKTKHRADADAVPDYY